ncbi:MAG: Serine/threonine protein kinase-related protein [Verrucomicrobia bacterium]|jgi:serine/threonine protein kinase|nr:Serine/threonine protein kinase-related protein [Verrucomicrobiota bacterium]
MCPQCGKSTSAVPAQAEKPSLGQLGDYKIIRAVAKGGMGEVFEATQLRLGRSVALKILNRNLATDQQFLQRFEREARAAAALNHPNLVHVYDFAVEDGQAYLVMEFIEGQDLAKIVAQAGKMPLKDALRIVADVASALQEAHIKGIIHRDIKPANILLTKKGVVKVSDLGLARRLDDDSDLTATGAGIGTPHFMSPEQARDAHHVDHRADIYSLGITLLYLLTGKRPYEGKSSYSIVLAHSTEPLPSGLELGTELPPHVEALIQRMAAKLPAERYADYGTLLADIKRVQRGEMPEGKPGEATSTQPIGAPVPVPVSSTKPNQPKPLDITATVPSPTLPTATQTGESRFWQIAMAVGVLCTAIISLVALMHSLKNKEGDKKDGAPVISVEQSSQQNPPPHQRGKDLTYEERRLLEEMMAEGKGGRGGRPLPLPPLHPVDTEPLKSTIPPQMLSEADEYATKNPTNYNSILIRYQQVQKKAAGLPVGRIADQKVREWTDKRDAAGEKAVLEFEERLKELLPDSHVKAMGVWRYFPDELRSDLVDRRVGEVVEKYPPPDGGKKGKGGRQPGGGPPP